MKNIITSIGNFLNGGKTAKSARGRIAKLREREGGNGSLSRQDQEKIKREEAIITRAVAIRRLLAGVGLGAAVVGGVIIDSISDSSKKTPEKANAEENKEGTEEKTERLIKRVETGFKKFEERVMPLIEKETAGNDFMREQFIGPFKLVDMNKENPRRNLERLRRTTSASRIRLGNPYHFFYGIKEETNAATGRKNFAAQYSPMEKAVLLNENLDPENILDMLVLYHELKHAAHDGNTRMGIRTKEQEESYEKFYTGKLGEKPRINVIDEASAYAFEIEILDILVGGRLKNGNANAEEIAGLVKARQDQIGLINVLIELSQSYYPERMSGGNHTEKFTDKIGDIYAKEGYEVYIPTTRGGLKKIR